jgi:polyhydroxyalkanoate synthesis regulator phasin
MRDALRSYLQIATGLTEMTVHRVTEAARQLVEKSGVDLEQMPTQVAQQAQAVPQYVQQVADELFATGKANRDLLVGVVRSEVDKAMARLRPWTDDVKRVDDDLARVERRVTDLEHRLAVASAAPRASRVSVVAEDEEPVQVRGGGARAAAGEPAADSTVAKRTITPAKTARKAAAKKAPAKKTAAKKTTTAKSATAQAAPAKTATAKTTPAKPTSAKPSATKQAAAKTTPAKKTPAKTAPAKKTAAPQADSAPAASPEPPAGTGE